MAELVIEQPGVPTLTVPLDKPELTLGRAEDNEVCLVADEVSRRHAKFSRTAERFLVTDLNSLNGTYVNRQRVTKRILTHLDEIWLGGRCRIVFRNEQPEPPQQQGPAEQAPPSSDSTLMTDLAKISEEMEEVGNTLTMITKAADSGAAPARSMIPKETYKPEPDQPALAPEDLRKMSRAFRRLQALYHVTQTIAGNIDLQNRLAAVLDKTIEEVGAQRGFIMLYDDESGQLLPTVARAMGGELTESSPSMSIANRAAKTGEPLLVQNTMADSQFSSSQSIIMQQINSAMCVPLKVEDRILGSIYVDVRNASADFTEEDLELFATMASQSAMAIENARLYEQMLEAEKKRANLGRFLSPGIVDKIMAEEADLVLGGTKRTVATMFCDIRSFTTISEQISPDAMVDLLNEHFTAMTRIIFEQQGTLDKFIGDAIMAVFGSPISADNDPARAVAAAINMQRANQQLNAKRESEGNPRLDMGIGIATGEVVAAYVGSPDRMEFTVIGDRVNIASRLCSAADGGQIVVCGETCDALDNQVRCEEMGAIALKGKDERVHAYVVPWVN